MRACARWLILAALLPILHTLILWAFGWRREWVKGAGCGPHYVDPLHTHHLYLRDRAVILASERAAYASQRRRGRRPAVRELPR